MTEVDNLLEKITDPMVVIIRVVGLMAGYFWFFWEFIGFLYFSECPPKLICGFTWRLQKSLQLVIVRFLHRYASRIVWSNREKKLDPTRCHVRSPTNDRPSSLAEQTTKISTSKEERVWMLCDTKPDATHLPKYSKWLSSSMDPSHSIGWQEQRGLFF